MSAKQKSQRGFVAVTLITLLAVALTIVIYATLLGTFTGGDVGVVSLDGTIKYNEDNSTTWSTTLPNVANGSSWFVMFNTTSGGYSGSVNITWQLQNNAGSWADVGGAVQYTNNFDLTGSVQEIFCSSNGAQSGNYDWGTTWTTTAGTYRIRITIETA